MAAVGGMSAVMDRIRAKADTWHRPHWMVLGASLFAALEAVWPHLPPTGRGLVPFVFAAWWARWNWRLSEPHLNRKDRKVARDARRSGAIAKALLDASGPLTAYEVAKEAQVRPGVVYPAMHRMLDAGWLTDSWKDQSEGGKQRPPLRYYELTDLGHGHLRGEP